VYVSKIPETTQTLGPSDCCLCTALLTQNRCSGDPPKLRTVKLKNSNALAKKMKMDSR
jgi:hypothetical protein